MEPENNTVKSRFFINALIFFALIMALIFSAYALKKNHAKTMRIDIAAGVVKRVLPNGAIIIFKQVPGSWVSAVRTFIKTGSAYEGKYEDFGLSHLIEHMLFKGTDKHGVGEISRILQQLGAQQNAWTSYENICFHVVVPAENTVPAMSIMAEAVLHSSFDPVELASEKEVVISELRRGLDNPGQYVDNLFFATAYRLHPYRFPVVGRLDLFRSITRDDLVDYYRTTFKPDNMVFICVGQFNEKAVLKAIEEQFATFREYPALKTEPPAEPPQVSPRFNEERRPQAKSTHLIMGWKTVDTLDPDMVPLDVLAVMLGQGETSPLNLLLKERLGLVQSIATWSYTPRCKGVFTIEAEFPDRNLKQVTNIIGKIISDPWKVLNHRELNRAKNQIVAGYVNSLQTVDGQANELAQNEISYGDFSYSRKYVEKVNAVRLDDIHRVLERYIVPDGLNMALVRPMLEETNRQNATQTNTALHIEKKSCRNGLKVLFIEKKGLPLINLKFIVKGGLLLNESPGLDNFVNEMSSKGNLRYPGLAGSKILENLGGDLSAYSGNNSSGLTVNVLEKDLDKGLNVLYHAVRDATFPEKALRQLKSETIENIKSQDEMIFTVGMNELKRIAYGNSKYSFNRLGTISSVSQINRAKLMDFYKKHYSASDSVLIVTGDPSQAEKTRILGKFGGLTGGSATGGDEISIPSSDDRVIMDTEKKRSLLLIGYPIPSVTNSSRYAVEVLNSICSGLGSRFFVELRDRRHLGYEVGATSLFMLKSGLFVFYVATERNQLSAAEQAVLEQVASLVSSPVAADELERAKNDIAGDFMAREQAYDSVALDAGLFELYYGDQSLYGSYIRNIRNVTSDDILKLCRQIFSQGRKTVIIRGKGD